MRVREKIILIDQTISGTARMQIIRAAHSVTLEERRQFIAFLPAASKIARQPVMSRK